MWTQCIEERGSVDVIDLDFQKTSDTVPHHRLQCKQWERWKHAEGDCLLANQFLVIDCEHSSKAPLSWWYTPGQCTGSRTVLDLHRRLEPSRATPRCLKMTPSCSQGVTPRMIQLQHKMIWTACVIGLRTGSFRSTLKLQGTVILPKELGRLI